MTAERDRRLHIPIRPDGTAWDRTFTSTAAAWRAVVMGTNSPAEARQRKAEMGRAGCRVQIRLTVIHSGMVTALVALLTASAAAAQPICPQFSPAGVPPALLNPKLGQRVTVLCNEGYAVAASGITRGTLWSAEHLTAAGVASARDTRRVSAFHPEDRLPPEDQAQIGDYRASGYDRGHMAPSGDMSTPTAQAESFSLANVVPQTAQLNRGVWEGIESAVRTLADQQGELYLMTGPAFVGSALQSIGAGVLVPTSTWKAVYDPRAGGAGVYVCQNTARPRCAVVSVAVLAQGTGIEPFPALPARVKAVAMALPDPEQSHYASRRRRPRPLETGSFLEQLFNRIGPPR